MRVFCCIDRCQPGVDGKAQIWVAACVMLSKRIVARKRGGDGDLLRRKIEIGDAVSRWGRNKTTEPPGRPKNEFRARRQIPAGNGLERHQRTPVAAIMPDLELDQPHPTQRRAKLSQRLQLRQFRVQRGLLEKRVVIERELPRVGAWPSAENTETGKSLLETSRAEMSVLVNVPRLIDVRDQIPLEIVPIVDNAPIQRGVQRNSIALHSC